MSAAGNTSAGGSTARATLFGICAAAFFAAQHPLCKPAVSAGGAIALSSVAISASVVSIPVMLGISRSHREFREIFIERTLLLKIVGLSSLGWMTAVIYAVCLGKIHPVLASIFLNTSPIWSACWTIWISKLETPRLFMLPAVTFFGSVTVASLFMGTKSIVLPWEAFLILLVPMLYTLRAHLLVRWFPGRSQLAVLSASTLVSSILTVLPFLGGRWLYPASTIVSGVTLVAWILFLCGSAAVIIGGCFYQLSIQARNNDSAYATSFNLLIPSLSAVYVWSLSGLPWFSDQRPDPMYIAIIVPVGMAFLVYAVANLRATGERR